MLSLSLKFFSIFSLTFFSTTTRIVCALSSTTINVWYCVIFRRTSNEFQEKRTRWKKICRLKIEFFRMFVIFSTITRFSRSRCRLNIRSRELRRLCYDDSNENEKVRRCNEESRLKRRRNLIFHEKNCHSRWWISFENRNETKNFDRVVICSRSITSCVINFLVFVFYFFRYCCINYVSRFNWAIKQISHCSRRRCAIARAIATFCAFLIEVMWR